MGRGGEGEAGSATETLLREQGAWELGLPAGGELDAVVRVPIRVQPLPGRLIATWDLPLLYTVMSPALPFISERKRFSMGQLGLPRTSLSWELELGPLRGRVTGTLPNAVLVVPWYVGGAEATFELGLAL